MKCIYCGSELKEGSLFCSHCGKEVQIVPDYNIYDDDYLKALLTENGEESVPLKNGNSLKQTTSGRTSSNGNSVKVPEDPKKKTEQKRKLKIIIASVIAVVAGLVIVLVLVGTSIRKSHDNSFDYQVEMAEKAYHSGNIDEAISYYEKALSLDKENIDVRLTLAEIYMEKKDYDSALVLYQEVIQKDNKNQTACENLIAIYEEQKNTDAILALADAVDDSLKDLFSDYMVTPPEFSIAGGEYEARQSVELSTSGNYNIYYTTDGSDPIERGIIYSGPIELSENNKTYMIKAVCRNEKEVYSDVVTNEYTGYADRNTGRWRFWRRDESYRNSSGWLQRLLYLGWKHAECDKQPLYAANHSSGRKQCVIGHYHRQYDRTVFGYIPWKFYILFGRL